MVHILDGDAMTRRHRYRGHRRQSYICTDVDQLVELRASQRTYNGAYMRTALGILGYSLTVLRLFDRKFYRSILYAALASLLSLCAFLRARHSRHDYADRNDVGNTVHISAIPTVGQEHKPLGRPFVTAGHVVALVSGVVATTEITLLVLVLRL